VKKSVTAKSAASAETKKSAAAAKPATSAKTAQVKSVASSKSGVKSDAAVSNAKSKVIDSADKLATEKVAVASETKQDSGLSAGDKPKRASENL
jgi:hypothetical protein